MKLYRVLKMVAGRRVHTNNTVWKLVIKVLNMILVLNMIIKVVLVYLRVNHLLLLNRINEYNVCITLST